MSPISRRSLLRAGALLPLGTAACSDDNADPTTPTADAGLPDAEADTSPADATTDDAGLDPSDAGDDATTSPDATGDDDAETDTGAGDTDEPGAPTNAFIKGPWLQVMGAGAVRLIGEAAFGEPVEVTLTPEGGEALSLETTATSADITFFWPRIPLRNVTLPDEAGTVWRHQVTFADLTPDTRYTWRIERDGAVHEGTFRSSPSAEGAFRLVWVSDTMQPLGPQVAATMAPFAPDLVVHGGDIQYQSNPLDTWNGFFAYFRGLFEQAPTHFTIGNHEYEDYEEYEEIWVRLLGDQGDTQFDPTVHAFTYGGVRFLILNSERQFGVEGAQMDWLRAQLEAAAADPEIRAIVPCFHRPTYSFSRYRPVIERRELTDALFREFGVRLVLMGHCHCYERFENEGITYLMDGGGGASAYDPNHNRWFFEQERPEDLPLRVTSQAGQGGLVLDFGDDGTMRGQRIGINGEVQDTFEVDLG
jgi:predicted phosphodiesterase